MAKPRYPEGLSLPLPDKCTGLTAEDFGLPSSAAEVRLVSFTVKYKDGDGKPQQLEVRCDMNGFQHGIRYLFAEHDRRYGW